MKRRDVKKGDRVRATRTVYHALRRLNSHVFIDLRKDVVLRCVVNDRTLKHVRYSFDDDDERLPVVYEYVMGDHSALDRDDGPAIVRADGAEWWYRDGKLHRDDDPTYVFIDGTKEWWRDGKLHRDDGPAIVRADGAEEWWRDDKHHRDDGPAYVGTDGTKEWWRDGKRVSEPKKDGPAKTTGVACAVEWPGSVSATRIPRVGQAFRSADGGTFVRVSLDQNVKCRLLSHDDDGGSIFCLDLSSGMPCVSWWGDDDEHHPGMTVTPLEGGRLVLMGPDEEGR